MNSFHQKYKNIKLTERNRKYYLYKVTDRETNENRVIRTINADLHSNVFVKNLYKVNKPMQAIDDKNIIKIYDIGNIDDIYYIEQEEFEGVSLKSIFRDKIYLSNEQCLNIIKDICNGLKAFHKKGQMYRRLHPSNIIVGKDNITKLDPIGYIDTNINDKRYMSPEQSINGYVKVQSDIYTLGIILYEMIYRVKAVKYNEKENNDLYNTLLKGIDLDIKDIDVNIKYIISRMTNRKPAKRYESLDAVIEDIDYYLEHGEVCFVETTNVVSNIRNINKSKKQNIEVYYDEDMEYENVENYDFSQISNVEKVRKFGRFTSIAIILIVVCIVGGRLAYSIKNISLSQKQTNESKQTNEVRQDVQTLAQKDSLDNNEDLETESEPEIIEAEVDNQSSQIQTKPTTNVQTKPETTVKPNTKPETKPEVKPESKPKPQPKPDPKPEEKPEPKPESKPEEKPEPSPDPKPEPEEKPEPKPDPEPEEKPETDTEPEEK